jgi:transcriptional regulator with XRE-family HTH domain
MHQMIEWLEQKRKAKGMTQDAFTRGMGIHPAYYSRLKKGGEPSLDFRDRVLHAFPSAPARLFLPAGGNNEVTRRG